MVSPSDPPVWMVWRFRPEEIRDARGESPHLRRSQSFVEQPPDHEMGSGVATVRRKSQCQILGRGEFREDGRRLVRVNSILWLRDGHALDPDPPLPGRTVPVNAL
jgi:hypothetical protein